MIFPVACCLGDSLSAAANATYETDISGREVAVVRGPYWCCFPCQRASYFSNKLHHLALELSVVLYQLVNYPVHRFCLYVSQKLHFLFHYSFYPVGEHFLQSSQLCLNSQFGFTVLQILQGLAKCGQVLAVVFSVVSVVLASGVVLMSQVKDFPLVPERILFIGVVCHIGGFLGMSTNCPSGVPGLSGVVGGGVRHRRLGEFPLRNYVTQWCMIFREKRNELRNTRGTGIDWIIGARGLGCDAITGGSF